MAPKKRATKESTGSEPASKAQRQDNGEGPSTTRSEPEHANESPSDAQDETTSEQHEPEDPYRYMCIATPRWAEADLDEEIGEGQAPAGIELHGKPSSEHPDWEWVVMDETWSIVTEWHRRTDYCQPDNFDMYIYNDFYGYGLAELQQNLLVKFNEQFSKKQKSLEAMWTVISGLLHWMLLEGDNWISHDDGEGESQMYSMIGCAILTMLHELDRAGDLKQDSRIKDLGLVMCMALEWTDGLDDYGVEEGNINWRNTIVAYAKKAGIDLRSVPIFNAQELVDGVDDDLASEVSGQSKADRFDWRKKFKEYEAAYGTKKRANGKPSLGGTEFDITRFSSAERAHHNFDKVDPLPKDKPEGAVFMLR